MRLFSKLLNQNRLTRYLKNRRNGLINFYFLKRNSRSSQFILLKLQNTRNIVFSIAFNKPECVEVMLLAWKKYAKNTQLVIIDNSSDFNARSQIKELCFANRNLYLALPKNPEWHPNRSHALAMNWVFYNIVKECKPIHFGYLDHDCFPFNNFDLDKKMNEFFIYGEKRISEKYPEFWNLWAGFCFFNYGFTQSQGGNMNFIHSIELGLDTGGNNWRSLYRNIPNENCLFSNSLKKRLVDENGTLTDFGVMDNFVHFGSGSRKDKGNLISLRKYQSVLSQLNDSEPRC